MYTEPNSRTIEAPKRRQPTHAAHAEPVSHDARVLTRGGTAAEIHLDGVRYILRITRQGKLILTK